MQVVDVGEIKEVECGTTVNRVNEELANGWVLLGMRMTQMIEGDCTNEYPVYIVGKPRANTTPPTFDFTHFTQVKEVDLCQNWEGVNNELRAGWRILAIRLYEVIEGSKKNQYAVYIMGK